MDKGSLGHSKDFGGFHKDMGSLGHSKDLVGLGPIKDKGYVEDKTFLVFPNWYTDILIRENHKKAQRKARITEGGE